MSLEWKKKQTSHVSSSQDGPVPREGRVVSPCLTKHCGLPKGGLTRRPSAWDADQVPGPWSSVPPSSISCLPIAHPLTDSQSSRTGGHQWGWMSELGSWLPPLLSSVRKRSPREAAVRRCSAYCFSLHKERPPAWQAPEIVHEAPREMSLQHPTSFQTSR